MIDLGDTVLARRRDVADAMVDGVRVAMSAEHRRIHQLNVTAAAIWDAIGTGSTASEVATRVAARFGVDAGSISADVADTLARFRDGGLLEVRGGGVAAVLSAPERGRSDRVTLRPRPSTRTTRAVCVVDALRARMVIEVDVENQQGVRLAESLSDALAPLESLEHVDLRDPAIAMTSVHTLRLEPSGRGWAVLLDGEVIVDPQPAPFAYRQALAAVNRCAIESATTSLVLHASAIEFRDGVVVFAGRSNSGKSTLAAQLTALGYGYLTDEATAIDVHTLDVAPFPKALCIDPGAHELFPELEPAMQIGSAWDVDPRSIGPGRVSAGGPLAAVVLPTYRTDSQLRLEQLATLDAVTALLENSFDFAETGADAAAALFAVASHTPCYRLLHGGVGQIETLVDLFGDPVRP